MNAEQLEILETAMKWGRRRGLWAGLALGIILGGIVGLLIGASLGDTVTIIPLAPGIET